MVKLEIQNKTQNQYGTQNMQVPLNGNKPEKKIRAGPISATIWKNVNSKEGKTFEIRSVNLERGYQDKNGNWKNTNYLRLNDLPRAKLVLEEAYRYLVMKNEKQEVVI